MLAEALQHAREAFCRRIRLDVLPTREPAIALYRSCGFTVESAPDANPHGLTVMAADVSLLSPNRLDRVSRSQIVSSNRAESHGDHSVPAILATSWALITNAERLFGLSDRTGT